MNWNDRIRAALTTPDGLPDEDVVEELAQHARTTYNAARADGCSHEEAAHRVDDLIVVWTRERARLHHPSHRPTYVELPSGAPSWWSGTGDEARYALRLLLRQPRAALLVILTMALGIGATTTLFSVTYGVLLKPLPWPDSDRLVALTETRGGNPARFGAFTNAMYWVWGGPSATIEGIGAWSTRTMTLTGTGDPDRIRLASVSASLFRVLGVRAMRGSLFTEADETARVVVLSEGLWRDRFGADPAAINRVIELDGQAYRVLGVLSRDAAFPDTQRQAWIPFRVLPPASGFATFDVVARLRPGVTPQQAAAEATARGPSAPDPGITATAIFGKAGPIAISAVPLRESFTSEVRTPLLVLLAAVGLMLITATANISALRLAQATTRRREIAIRSAIGADTARVARQLLIENLILGAIGGAVGLGFAWWLHRALPSLLPPDFPRGDDLGISLVVVAFATGISVLASVAFGLAPVARARRLNIVQTLAEDRSPSGMSHRSQRGDVRVPIMIGQVAIACILLVGASLLARSFVAMLDADRGYNPTGILVARLSLPASIFSADRRHALVTDALARLSQLPGVAEASFSSESPLTPGGSTVAMTIKGPDGAMMAMQASPRTVSPKYFETLRMRIVAGRTFTTADTDGAPPVIIVSQSFARRYLGNNPIGARLPFIAGYQFGSQTPPRDGDVIGVVDDLRYVSTQSVSNPEIYYPATQLNGRLGVPTVTLFLRTSTDPRSLALPLRTTLRNVDPQLVAEGVATMEERLLTSLARPRLYATLLVGFAVVALTIAAVGLFGVLSFLVAQRSHEIAVRSAIGATQRDIVALVLRQSMAVTVIGVFTGLAGSAVLMRSLSSLLYGVTTYDALTYVAMPLIVVIVSLAACAAPALRAARLDPVQVLRG
jgi:predicted permease